MECNKDEAFRAKTIAEEKLGKRDYFSAQKFALIANNLYKDLEGLSQLLETVNVYVASEKKISGEVDWYGVLGVDDPSTDEETIKKQYRKLALGLHPDKNKSVGADGAFMLISQAWSLLSDKEKRLTYDQKRGLRGSQQRVWLHGPGQTSNQPNGVFSFSNRWTATPEAQTAGQTSRPGMDGVFSSGNGPSQVPNGSKAKSNGAQEKSSGATEKNNGGKKKKNNNGAKENGNGTHAKNNGTRAKSNGTKAPRKPMPSPAQRADTFWTMCHLCHYHYEFVREYLGRNLRCVTCHQPFIGNETPPPPNFGNLSANVPQEQQQVRGEDVPDKNPHGSGENVQASETRRDHNHIDRTPVKHSPASKKARRGPAQNVHDAKKNLQEANKSGARTKAHAKDQVKNATPAHEPGKNLQSVINANSQKAEVSGTATIGSMGNSSAAKSATVQMAPGKSKRARPETTASGGLQKRPHNENSRNKMSHDLAQASGGFGTKSAPVINGFSGTHHQPIFRDFGSPVWRKLMMGRARNEIQSKLSLWQSQDVEEDGNNNITGMEMQDQNGRRNLSMNGKSSKEKAASAAMTVPDPDFHNFDNDRTEMSFGNDEVWSVYDDNDGMPRLYALIHKVISRKQSFKVKMSWLNSKTNSEFSTTMDWVSSGFIKTCGEFRIGKWVTFTSMDVFSRKINWSKGTRGSILIYPQKDDVWALYRDWSSEWDMNTPREAVYKYDMAMVLDEYNEEQGISVAPLVKVAGFKTVFRPNLDPQAIKRVPKKEMFRFSHRVPHHVLTGEESQDAPRGCLELDPAAVPLELLTVVKDMDATVSDNANGDA